MQKRQATVMKLDDTYCVLSSSKYYLTYERRLYRSRFTARHMNTKASPISNLLFCGHSIVKGVLLQDYISLTKTYTIIDRIEKCNNAMYVSTHIPIASSS